MKGHDAADLSPVPSPFPWLGVPFLSVSIAMHVSLLPFFVPHTSTLYFRWAFSELTSAPVKLPWSLIAPGWPKFALMAQLGYCPLACGYLHPHQIPFWSPEVPGVI